MRARRALLPGGLRDDVTVVLDGALVREVRRARAGDPEPLDGVLVPGLVNAHTHVELGAWAGRVAGGEGLCRWVRRLREAAAEATVDGAHDGAWQLAASGVAAVADTSNRGDTGEDLVAAGISGVVHHELLTLDRSRVGEASMAAQRAHRRIAGAHAEVEVRAAPHAPYSTAPALIRACAAAPGTAPTSIHLAEDRAEVELLRDRTGPWADYLDALGIDWRWWRAPGATPVAYLHQLGVLGPGLLAVHCVHVDAADRALLAATRTPVCLCPRSNTHISGDLPDVGALLAAGVRLCVGTDSLASSPDLDPLGEIPLLADRAPEVPVATWLSLATAGGADALRLSGLGRLVPGAAPGLLLLEVDDPETLRRAAPRRRWIVRPNPHAAAAGPLPRDPAPEAQ